MTSPALSRPETDQRAARAWHHRHVVTFGDTNVVGNVYFANYFKWQGECREVGIAERYPEMADDLAKGFGMITEYAHMDFAHEALLFDVIDIQMVALSVSRTRIEFEFTFVRESDGLELGRGRQAVIWINPQQRPSLMPDRLYEISREMLVDEAI